MSLKEYKPGTTFTGRMGRTVSESERAWPAPVRFTPNAPNIVYIVLDETGYGQYTSPFPFTGTITKVTVDVSGKPDHDEDEVKESQARVAMARR